MNRAVLSILVSNHFGVLTRVTNLFSQRGFNIDSLAVGETENENYSRLRRAGMQRVSIRSSCSWISWRM